MLSLRPVFTSYPWISSNPLTLILNLDLKQCPTSYRPLRFRMIVILPCSLRFNCKYRCSFSLLYSPVIHRLSTFDSIHRSFIRIVATNQRSYGQLEIESIPGFSASESSRIHLPRSSDCSSRLWWWGAQKYSELESAKVDANFHRSATTRSVMDNWR